MSAALHQEFQKDRGVKELCASGLLDMSMQTTEITHWEEFHATVRIPALPGLWDGPQ